jgi:hypothetical protein
MVAVVGVSMPRFYLYRVSFKLLVDQVLILSNYVIEQEDKEKDWEKKG